MSTPTVCGPGETRRQPAPFGPLAALEGAAATFTRAALRGMHPYSRPVGELTDPCTVACDVDGVEVTVYDAPSNARRAAWHAHWHHDRNAHGGFDVLDRERMKTAPPLPTFHATVIAHGTWDDVRAWLDEDPT